MPVNCALKHPGFLKKPYWQKMLFLAINAKAERGFLIFFQYFHWLACFLSCVCTHPGGIFNKQGYHLFIIKKGVVMRKSKYNILFSVVVAASFFALTGCSSNYSLETTSGKTILTHGKPELDEDTGLVSYEDASTGATQQINRDQIKNMSELNL